MTPGSRARFVAAYSKLVADVWSDPGRESLLEIDARRLLADYDIALPAGVTVDVVRDDGDVTPNLDTQVAAWQATEANGTFVLYVPALDPMEDGELSEHELDAVVAGMDSSCACCCPCCCS